jgi:hypothetical protein
LGYEPQRRDALFTVPQFDFYFKITIPKARKEREIIERDYLGRIVASKVSEITYPTT